MQPASQQRPSQQHQRTSVGSLAGAAAAAAEWSSAQRAEPKCTKVIYFRHLYHQSSNSQHSITFLSATHLYSTRTSPPDIHTAYLAQSTPSHTLTLHTFTKAQPSTVSLQSSFAHAEIPKRRDKLERVSRRNTQRIPLHSFVHCHIPGCASSRSLASTPHAAQF